MENKIDQIIDLLEIPNVDVDAKTALNNMKILNLLVELRAEIEQLRIAEVMQVKPEKATFCKRCQGQGYFYDHNVKGIVQCCKK